MDKKRLFFWSLYDFANSIIYINFLLYFSQWLVIDGGLSDFWYNAIFAITSIMLLLTAPVLASFTDKYGGRKYFLNFSTLGIFLGYSLSVFFAYNNPENIFIIALFFLIGQYFYQLSFVFYNAFLADISDVENRSKTSGIGQFVNNFGQVAGLIIAIPLATNRLQPLIPSLSLFLLLALPMMIFFKDNKPKSKSILNIRIIKNEKNNFFRKTSYFFKFSLAIPMLLSFFFFNDALITISNNYSIFMERVFGVSDLTKNLLLLSILLISSLGGLFSGYVADKIGSFKMLKYVLVGWIILIPCISLSKTLLLLSIFSVSLGFLMGSILTVSRSYFSELLVKEEQGFGFSFYTLAERFATLFGPVTYGLIVSGFKATSFSYRMAVLSMTTFVFVGLIVLIKWKRETSLANKMNF